MTKRKSISKKVRFEVFKRDDFTCQYCGNKAPKIVLQIDHIKPVSKGGDNSIINLVTSCSECNNGKSDRELSDDSILQQQRDQIELLNEKRQQLEMMMEWREEFKKNESDEYSKAIDYFNGLWENNILNKSGELIIKKLVKKFGLINTLDATDLSFEKYNYENNSESDNCKNVLNKIGGICYLKTQPDWVKKISYIKGIARNKFYINEYIAATQLKNFYKKGYCLDDLISKLQENCFRNWTQFRDYITITEGNDNE